MFTGMTGLARASHSSLLHCASHRFCAIIIESLLTIVFALRFCGVLGQMALTATATRIVLWRPRLLVTVGSLIVAAMVLQLPSANAELPAIEQTVADVPLHSIIDVLNQLVDDFADGKFVKGLPGAAKIWARRNLVQQMPSVSKYKAMMGSGLGGVYSQAPNIQYSYNLMLPPMQRDPSAPPLPDPELLWEQLFNRTTFKREDRHFGNFIFVSFINFFLEDVLRTNANDPAQVSPEAYPTDVGLYAVYGRAGQTNITACPVAMPTYTMGDAFDQRSNTHWGHLFWITMYRLEHNRLCEVLARAHPELDGVDLYYRVRTLLCLVNIKILF